MAKSTIDRIYVLKCTLCNSEFHSLANCGYYYEGKPVCVPCYDKGVGLMCETHMVMRCNSCKEKRDDYRYKQKNWKTRAEALSELASVRADGSKVAAATGGDPSLDPLQSID